MLRSPRQLPQGSWFHITLRCNSRQSLIAKGLSRNVLLAVLAKDFSALPKSFFCRPAEVVGPDLVGCRLVKRQTDGSMLWGVEAYPQEDLACHVYRLRTPQNKTLFGEQGGLGGAGSLMNQYC